ncbi:MAG: MazG-like family protein [Candidatus Heimdallarchaeaceae archaeon]
MEFSTIIQEIHDFLESRGWLDFSPNDVFIHLIEELGEMGKHLLFNSEYKSEKMGHIRPSKEDLEREFAQSFSLFLQLCIILDINIEQVWKRELEIMKKRFPPTDKQK